MAEYLAMRIAAGALDYKAVIARYAKIKEQIDDGLRRRGREDLIDDIEESADKGV